MKTFFASMLAKVVYRLVSRRSPRAEIIAGTPAAALIGALCALLIDDPTLAAAIAAPLGSLVTVLVNLLAAEGPEPDKTESES
jgi:CBS-domain-containing membrane protein